MTLSMAGLPFRECNALSDSTPTVAGSYPFAEKYSLNPLVVASSADIWSGNCEYWMIVSRRSFEMPNACAIKRGKYVWPPTSATFVIRGSPASAAYLKPFNAAAAPANGSVFAANSLSGAFALYPTGLPKSSSTMRGPVELGAFCIPCSSASNIASLSGVGPIGLPNDTSP